jgi:hypothetical protein
MIGFKRWVGRTFVSDASKFIADPTNLGFSGSLIAKAGHVASELNALALGEPLSADLAPIDNSQEAPKDAELRLEFAAGERLSLDFAYRDVAKQPRIIPLLEEDNAVRHYQIIKLNSGHGGIAGNILIPDTKTESTRIYVNFRGTQLHIFSSVHLNFEHCAGEESFYTHFNQIMGQIDSLIGQVSNEKKKPIQLIFSGHSLGGALSQHAHFAAMLLAAKALREDLIKEDVDLCTQESIQLTKEGFKQYLTSKYQITQKMKTFEHFAKVDLFELHSWGMAGVSKTIESCSNIFADILHDNGKKIRARYGYNTLDLVPRCGEANTLSDCKGDVACVVISDQSLNVTRSIVSGCIDGVVAGTLFGGPYGAVVGATTAVVKGLAPINDAHNNFHYGPFGELLANKEYKTHQNTTEAGKKAIKAAFDNKLPILQKPLLVRAKTALQQVGDFGASVKESATLSAVTTLRAIYRVAPKLKA